MGRIEDVQLGMSLLARLGYSAEAFGADRNAWLLDVTARKGWQLADDRLVTVNVEGSSRRETAGFTNTVYRASASYYRKLFDIQMLAASVDLVATDGLDLDQQALLGGDSGLRGYPLRYQSGTSRATPNLGMLHDAGSGLRLSSPKASSGSVVHLDFAVPLNAPSSVSGLQVSVKTKASF